MSQNFEKVVKCLYEVAAVCILSSGDVEENYQSDIDEKMAALMEGFSDEEKEKLDYLSECLSIAEDSFLKRFPHD